MSEWYRINSHTWGWLKADEIKVEGPFLRMIGVVKDHADRPFYTECLIPVADAVLIVPPSVEESK